MQAQASEKRVAAEQRASGLNMMEVGGRGDIEVMRRIFMPMKTDVLLDIQ